MRDGITGQVITPSDEDRPIFEQLKAELIEDFAPKTTMELRLANSIAWDTWRLDHLRAVEMNLYALGTQDPDCDIECDAPQLHTALSGALTFVKQSKNGPPEHLRTTPQPQHPQKHGEAPPNSRPSAKVTTNMT
jgi:hypothetical protein